MYFEYFQTKYYTSPRPTDTPFYSLKSYSEHSNSFKYSNPVAITLPDANRLNFQFLPHIKLTNAFNKSSTFSSY